MSSIDRMNRQERQAETFGRMAFSVFAWRPWRLKQGFRRAAIENLPVGERIA